MVLMYSDAKHTAQLQTTECPGKECMPCAFKELLILFLFFFLLFLLLLLLLVQLLLLLFFFIITST